MTTAQNKTPFNLFWYFIRERQSVYLKKEAGEPRPWTDDPILQKYKFTNVYRENDRVTRWITEHWRTPHARDPDLWFAMCVARYVNWPDTLEEIGYPIPWNRRRFKLTLARRTRQGEKVFTGAYIVHSRGKAPKGDYLADCVFTPLWRDKEKIRPRKGDTLAEFYSKLRKYNGMGSFMAAQVVADTKYAGVLLSAEDWYSFAAPGPGSRRGLNRLLKKPLDYQMSDEDWLAYINGLRCKAAITAKEWTEMHSQDIQNCLCEFDKWERVRLNQGRPRSKYPGI
jgi:hypothetical protein